MTIEQLTPEASDSLTKLLATRAELLATRHDDMSGRQVLMQVAVVAIGDETFGIPADGLQELIAVPPISPLPRIPPWMAGIAQIRGELVSIVNLAGWLGIRASSNPKFMAVVALSGRKLGLLADDLLGYRDVFSNEIAQDFSSSGSSDSGRPILVVTTDLVSVLDLNRLLDDEQLIVKHSK